MTTDRMRKLTAIALATLVLLSTAGLGAAAIGWDSENTDSATTSDISGTSNTVTFQPNNSSKTIHVEVTGFTGDKADLELQVRIDQPDMDHVFYSNASEQENNASAGTYEWDISHDELEDLPRDKDGGTYKFEVMNTSGDSDTEILNTSVTLDTSGDDGTTVIMAITDDAGDGDAALTNLEADTLENDEISKYFGAGDWIGAETRNTSEWTGYSTIDGVNQTVEVHLINDSAAEAYNDAAANYDDEDWMIQSTLWANGLPMKVYKNEAPDDVPDDHPYAVYDVDDEVLEITVQGEEYEGIQNFQMRGSGGLRYGFFTVAGEFGYSDAFSYAVPVI